MLRNRPCHHTSLFLFPLKFTEILVSHALLFRLQPALTAVCKHSWFSREHTRFFFKADQTGGSFCKFVFVVHTKRLSVHAALFYPCHVGDWDSTCRHNICFQTAYARCKLNIMVGLTLHTCVNFLYHRLVNAQWIFLYRNHLYKICTPAECQVVR
jgi:hypothetical protein